MFEMNLICMAVFFVNRVSNKSALCELEFKKLTWIKCEKRMSFRMIESKNV